MTAQTQPAQPEALRLVIDDLRTSHRLATSGKWTKGSSTHETVSIQPEREPYHIASFRHANDAAFCDAAHLHLPKLLDAFERQHARIAELEADGPQVERGERGDGEPWLGTMRQAWEDAKQAAEVEAKEVDRLREHIRLQSIVIKQHEEATEQLCEQLAGVGVTCNQLEAELTQLRKSKPQCEWTYNDEYFHWQTSCGNAHQFGDGGIHDNKYSHCPYCGGGIGEKTP